MEIPVLNEIMRDTVVEVDLDRIAFNVRQIKAMAGPGTQVAAVVKADGYGHGALGIAPAIMENGACLLAVATLSLSLIHISEAVWASPPSEASRLPQTAPCASCCP